MISAVSMLFYCKALSVSFHPTDDIKLVSFICQTEQDQDVGKALQELKEILIVTNVSVPVL